MIVPFPPPDATREEVDAYEKARAKQARSDRARVANLSANRTCRSCGDKGHRRGDACCPNYGTPVRWQAHGKPWTEPR